MQKDKHEKKKKQKNGETNKKTTTRITRKHRAKGKHGKTGKLEKGQRKNEETKKNTRQKNKSCRNDIVDVVQSGLVEAQRSRIIQAQCTMWMTMDDCAALRNTREGNGPQTEWLRMTTRRKGEQSELFRSSEGHRDVDQ